MSLPSRLLGANPSIQVSTLLSGSLSTPSAKQSFIPPTAFESIQTIDGNGSSIIEFSSIPQTYSHLQIRMVARLNSGGQYIQMRFNSDSVATNYSWHYMAADPSSNYTSGAADSRMMITQASATQYILSAAIIEIADYTSTTKHKVMRTFYGQEDNGTSAAEVTVASGAYYANTNAINQIEIVPNNSAVFGPGTQAALYGIKG